jgi:hypothetical protein
MCKLCIIAGAYSYRYVRSILRVLISVCCSVYCLCVSVYGTAATRCQLQITNISYFVPLIFPLPVGGGKSEALHMRGPATRRLADAGGHCALYAANCIDYRARPSLRSDVDVSMGTATDRV